MRSASIPLEVTTANARLASLGTVDPIVEVRRTWQVCVSHRVTFNLESTFPFTLQILTSVIWELAVRQARVKIRLVLTNARDASRAVTTRMFVMVSWETLASSKKERDLLDSLRLDQAGDSQRGPCGTPVVHLEYLVVQRGFHKILINRSTKL